MALSELNRNTFRGDRKAVHLQLLELFSQAQMNVTANFDKIADYCYERIKDIGGDFQNGNDISDAFENWIEKQTRYDI
jgi:hypothetical protein